MQLLYVNKFQCLQNKTNVHIYISYYFNRQARKDNRKKVKRRNLQSLGFKSMSEYHNQGLNHSSIS